MAGVARAVLGGRCHRRRRGRPRAGGRPHGLPRAHDRPRPARHARPAAARARRPGDVGAAGAAGGRGPPDLHGAEVAGGGRGDPSRRDRRPHRRRALDALPHRPLRGEHAAPDGAPPRPRARLPGRVAVHPLPRRSRSRAAPARAARPRRRPRARRRRARRPGQDALRPSARRRRSRRRGGRCAGHVLRRRTRGDRLVRAPRRRMVPSAGTTGSAPAVDRKAMPTTSTRRWVPRQYWSPGPPPSSRTPRRSSRGAPTQA